MPLNSLENLPINNFFTFNKLFIVITLASIIFGSATGYLLAGNTQNTPQSSSSPAQTSAPPQQAQHDSQTFRDFAEGVLQKRPTTKDPNEYVEGTHILIRYGTTPVALTSSVVDLSQYEGKKVKVYGETQKALREGWLMDVGKVEVEN